MLTDFKNLPNDSRIWIYQSNRKFIDSELNLDYEVFLRPRIKERLLLEYNDTKEKISRIFSKKQLKQIVVDERIDIEEIQKYFMSIFI